MVPVSRSTLEEEDDQGILAPSQERHKRPARSKEENSCTVEHLFQKQPRQQPGCQLVESPDSSWS